MPTITVPLDHLHPGPKNPRHEVGDVTELVEAIRANHWVSPLLVRPLPHRGEGHYEILAGERRWTAARFVPETEVECQLTELPPGRTPAGHAVIIGMIENVHRRDLNVIEKAKGFGQLRDEEHMTEQEIAKATGFHITTVSRALMLLEFSDQDQERIRKKEIRVQDAIDIVKKHRAKDRKTKGHKQPQPGWQPDHFTEFHLLSRSATKICNEREHNDRRRRGGACDACWEAAIRLDQTKILTAAMKDAGVDVAEVTAIAAGTHLTRSMNGTTL
jgi:ParB/RepB/Spo0J family partition protein